MPMAQKEQISIAISAVNWHYSIQQLHCYISYHGERTFLAVVVLINPQALEKSYSR
jgi:hypothetical protein